MKFAILHWCIIVFNPANIPFLALLLAAAIAPGGEIAFDVESGKPQALPLTGDWTLRAEHGRVLAEGAGEVTIDLPAMEPNTKLEAELTVGKRNYPIRIWAPRQLEGFAASFRSGDALKRKLVVRGLGEEADKAKAKIVVADRLSADVAAPLLLVFPDRRDFPLKLGDGYDQVILQPGPGDGKLGITFDNKTRTLDVNGNGIYLELLSGRRRTVIFSPGFDLGKITNVLLLKKLIGDEASGFRRGREQVRREFNLKSGNLPL
ncbi:MAG: hypothetical protein AB7F32_12680 [Victivallaceae bacterium]